MMENDLEIFRRVVESSPVIVLFCVVAIIALWRRLDKKDDALITLHKETTAALGTLTSVVEQLRQAIETRR